MAYDPTTPEGQVRLLLNDVDDPNYVFADAEITAFLTLEGHNVKRAAAQAIDVNASNEALASKVLRTQDLATDGAKVAAAMRAHADRLRQQADAADEAADGGFFQIVPMVGGGPCVPELTEHPVWWP